MLMGSAQADASTSTATDDVDYLSIQDEIALVNFYLTRQALFSRAFRLSETVEATAATYLKRFYTRNTCMDYHPKLVMSVDAAHSGSDLDRQHRLTCLFLATKTENSMINITDFAQKVKTPAKDILDLEFLVSQSLNFQYKVHHAHVAARGLFYDMQVRTIPLSASRIVVTTQRTDHDRRSRTTRSGRNGRSRPPSRRTTDRRRDPLYSLSNRSRRLLVERARRRRDLAASETSSYTSRDGRDARCRCGAEGVRVDQGDGRGETAGAREERGAGGDTSDR